MSLSRDHHHMSGQGDPQLHARDMHNRPFLSSLVSLVQNESKCVTFHMKMSSACSFIFKQITVIFIRMVSHLDSLSNRDTRELGNGLLSSTCFWRPWGGNSVKYLQL